VVNNFVEWFNSTNTPGNVDLSTASAAVYKFIGAFMCTVHAHTHTQSHTLARISVSDNEHLSTTSTAVLSEYPLADEHHRVISNWLLSVLVPRIYHSWFELYCTTANVRAIQQRGHLMSGVGMLTHPRDVTIITVPTK